MTEKMTVFAQTSLIKRVITSYQRLYLSYRLSELQFDFQFSITVFVIDLLPADTASVASSEDTTFNS